MSENNVKAKKDGNVSGPRLGMIYGVVIVIAIVVSALLLLATSNAYKGNQTLEALTERYIACQQDAASFREGSDELTNEARLFVVTGDPAHAQRFAEEVEVTQRRDKAIADVESYLVEGASFDYLQQAKAYSDELAETEDYAMRLAAQGFGVDLEEMPDSVKAVELTEADLSLSPDEQKARAVEMMFDDDYVSLKQNILDSVDQSLSALLETTRADQLRSQDAQQSLLIRQQILIFALLILTFAVVIITFILIVDPVMRSVSHIQEQREIPVTGAYEMRFLAHTYNDMFEQQTLNTQQLTYSATHDSLTGVHNRTAYDSLRLRLHQPDVGVLIIDVDKFKDFNDQYGHDVGDRVLQRVAQVLMQNFRSEDFIARIGGDEFCVIMMHAGTAMKELVGNKIARANEVLQHPTDGLPPISLSVGVAFGDRENPQGDIFKDADTALYEIKRTGRGRCGFY